MNLADRFESQKEAVAEILGHFIDDVQLRSQLARKLESELLDQLGFDHRDTERSDLASIWNASPSLDSRSSTSNAGVLRPDGIAGATYAFRMLVLAHVLSVLAAPRREQFTGFLTSLGHGMPEVEAYQADFVRA